MRKVYSFLFLVLSVVSSTIVDRPYAQFDEASTYDFEYKVADDEKQVYQRHKQNLLNKVVTGEYSWVDPLGTLHIVKYQADETGYHVLETVDRPEFVEVAPPTPGPKLNGRPKGHRSPRLNIRGQATSPRQQVVTPTPVAHLPTPSSVSLHSAGPSAAPATGRRLATPSPVISSSSRNLPTPSSVRFTAASPLASTLTPTVRPTTATPAPKEVTVASPSPVIASTAVPLVGPPSPSGRLFSFTTASPISVSPAGQRSATPSARIAPAISASSPFPSFPSSPKPRRRIVKKLRKRIKSLANRNGGLARSSKGNSGKIVRIVPVAKPFAKIPSSSPVPTLVRPLAVANPKQQISIAQPLVSVQPLIPVPVSQPLIGNKPLAPVPLPQVVSSAAGQRLRPVQVTVGPPRPRPFTVFQPLVSSSSSSSVGLSGPSLAPKIVEPVPADLSSVRVVPVQLTSKLSPQAPIQIAPTAVASRPASQDPPVSLQSAGLTGEDAAIESTSNIQEFLEEVAKKKKVKVEGLGQNYEY